MKIREQIQRKLKSSSLPFPFKPEEHRCNEKLGKDYSAIYYADLTQTTLAI